MIDYLIWVLLVSAWCFGFSNVFNQGQLLGVLGDWMDEKLPPLANNPLWACPKCMASIHGSIFYFIAFGEVFSFIYWILFVIAVSGINTVIINFQHED